MKEIVCRAHLAADIKRVMNIIIPLSQLIRQRPILKDHLNQSGNVFLNMFRYFDIQYLEPPTFLILLSTAVAEKMIPVKKGKAIVYASAQTLFAQKVMDMDDTPEAMAQTTHQISVAQATVVPLNAGPY